MKLLVVALLCLSSLGYADGTPDKFEFTAPAWPRSSEAEVASRGALGATVADGDLFVYKGANEEFFATYYLSEVGVRDNPRDRITAFNRGVLAGAAQKGQAKDPPIRSEGDSAMSLEQNYTLPGRTMALRVISTVDSAGILHGAFGLCAYPTTIAEPGCLVALASLQNKWPMATRTALDARVVGKSQAFTMAKLVGKILIMVLVLGTISFLIRRKANTPA